MSKTYSAGIVTAYGAAKRAGYQGTYEDFCRQQAGYAESAAAVETAKNTAVSAANTATTKATEATTAATEAQTAKTQTEQSASQALTDIETARTGAISAVQTEGQTQTANARAQAQAAAQSATTASTKASEASASATSAGQSATNAAASATSAANAASAAQAVLNSIPEDYSDLSVDVGQLKADLGAKGNLDTTDKSNLVNAINEVYGLFTAPTQEAVDNWLDEHPEATTTVQDGSLTYKKLITGTLNFVTPEMFGAKGDGITDDTEALTNAFKAGEGLLILKNGSTYLVSDLYINDVERLSVIGYGATIKVKKEFTFQSYLQRCCLRLEDCKSIKVEGVTFDAAWREIKAFHEMEVDTTLENYCVRLLGNCDQITFSHCVFGNQLKACIQTYGSWRGGELSNVDTSFIPNTNIEICDCVFGWNYTAGHHNLALQMLELPQVATDVNLNFHDNLVLQSGEHAIHIYYGNNNLKIENNIILNSGHEALEDYFIGGGSIVKGAGIEVTSCNKVKILNNKVKNAVSSLIIVAPDGWYTAGDIYDVVIDGNNVEQDSAYSEEFYGHGIAVINCERCTITNNVAKDIYETRNNGTENVGVIAIDSTDVIVTNNMSIGCETGLTASSSNSVVVSNNTAVNMINNFSRAIGIKFYNVNRLTCVGNLIDGESAVGTQVYGTQLDNVTGGSVSGNVFNKIANGGMFDASNAVTNVTIYGNIFIDTRYKYVWWGTHTDLVVDFVAVANN